MGLFRRKSKAPLNLARAYAPPTGHRLDDELLSILAATEGGLSAQRDWVHYVYCDTAEGAEEMMSVAAAAGWNARPLHEAFGIRANREDWPVNSTTVPAVRAFFEQLASRVPGGEYDGWEAST